jgi:flagellar basal-body rod modification protein FlgD
MSEISAAASYPLTNADTTTERAAGNTLLGKDEFLKILITQLSNQDPLEPLDQAEFIGQMAQFAEVEQTSNLNDKMEQIEGFIRFSSASMVGKEVSFVDYDGYSRDGKVEAVIFDEAGVSLKMKDGYIIPMERIERIY